MLHWTKHVMLEIVQDVKDWKLLTEKSVLSY